MNNKSKNTLRMLGIALLVLVLDQGTKYWVRTRLTLRETVTPIPALSSFFRIIHWKNTGVAFGMFQGQGWLIALIALVILVLLTVYFRQGPETPLYWQIAVGMQLGGALGNLLDRLMLGYVVDFLWFGDFPVFNIADAAIVFGAAVLVIGLTADEKREKETAAVKETEAETTETEEA